jgi:hypothetical protein
MADEVPSTAESGAVPVIGRDVGVRPRPTRATQFDCTDGVWRDFIFGMTAPKSLQLFRIMR